MLNTHYLSTFSLLVETGSFTKTAHKLGLTQPAVSQHIQKLEHELGETLLIRDGRHAKVTKAGKVLLDHIKGMEMCHEHFLLAWKAYLATKPSAE